MQGVCLITRPLLHSVRPSVNSGSLITDTLAGCTDFPNKNDSSERKLLSQDLHVSSDLVNLTTQCGDKVGQETFKLCP